MADEDEEVILKNGPLYEYLHEICNEEFDVYEKISSIPKEKNFELISSPVNKISSEVLSYLEALLQSNLLLDDDFTTLYSYITDLVASPRHYLHSFLPAGAAAISCILVLTYSGSVPSYSILNGFQDVLVTQYIQNQRRNTLVKLISCLKQLHFNIKKTVQSINEQNAYLKLKSLKNISNPDKYDDIDIIERKKRIEICTMSSILGKSIIEHIFASRLATLNLMETLPLNQPFDSMAHYLASLTNEELCIDKHFTDGILSQNFTPESIEGLKNIYVLMQSEFLRRFGMCFCPNLWLKKNSFSELTNVFSTAKRFLNSSISILNNLRIRKSQLFAGVPERKVEKKLEVVDGYNMVHKICASLNNLAFEVRVWEELFEDSRALQEDKINHILCKISEFRKDLMDCDSHLANAEKYFSKFKKYVPPVEIELPGSESMNHQVAQTQKDQSPDKCSPDGKNLDIYFGITDGLAELEEMDNYEVNSTVFPDFLMKELKSALLMKKSEFEERESQAVGNNPDYQKFLVHTETEPVEEKAKRPATPPQYTLPQIELHRMLASTVASLSIANNRNEECFGSSESSDTES